MSTSDELGHVRAAQAGDAATLAAIDAQSSMNPWAVSRFNTLCQAQPTATSRCLVAQYAGETAGFVVVSVVLDEAEIQNIAVASTHRRKGIARNLLQHALQDIRTAGAQRCHLEVRHTNQAARAMYGALGFTSVGRRRNYYRTDSGREDAVLMTIDWAEH